MKKMMITASVFLFSMALTTGAMAAGEYGSAAQQSPSQSEQQLGAGSAQQMQQEVKSTNKLIGKAVAGKQGQEIGNISDIMIDTQTGQVAYALVSAGGILGMGEEQYIVPWNALHADPQTGQLGLNISKEQLKNAPKGQTVANREQARKIFEFYGVSPYWEKAGQQPEQQPKMLEEKSKKQPMGK